MSLNISKYVSVFEGKTIWWCTGLAMWTARADILWN